MEANNPYEAPTSSVGGAEQFGDLSILSLAGRIGRVRYLGYAMAANLAIGLIAGIAAVALGTKNAETLQAAITVLQVIALGIVIAMLAIKRCHDLNWSGWLAFLVLVPVVNLAFLCIRGTPGPNRFGKPPPPNSTGVIVLAWLLPAVLVLGILAAIALPAYKQYIDNANAARAHTQLR